VTPVCAARQGRRAGTLGVLAVALLVAVPATGENGATPPVGPRSGRPPWDAGLALPSAAVATALVLAYLLAAASVWLGLRAVAGGWRPSPRGVALAGAIAVTALVLVPPFGSADHLNYAAYGRIAAQGGDPYVVPPDRWLGGTDPVVDGVRPPWRDTTSVYGPVATALQAAGSLVGGDSLRTTVWAGQLLVGGCFLLTAWLLDRMARGDPARRARVAVIWTLNPLLLGVLVGGAHLDAVSAAAAVACLAAGRRGGRVGLLFAGLALGVAAGTKVPYAAAGLAVLWAHRGRGPRQVAAAAVTMAATALTMAATAALVLVPAHLWAGPHVYDQTQRLSRYVSLASPWRAAVNAVELVTGPGVRAVIPAAFALLAGVVVLALAALLRGEAIDDDSGLVAPRALLVLGAAYLIAQPYSLPWYDALAWAPLALVATPVLEGLLLLRLTVLAIAYVPGRVEAVSPGVSDVMLGLRTFVAPVVTGGVLVWVLWRGLPPALRWARDARAARRSARSAAADYAAGRR